MHVGLARNAMVGMKETANKAALIHVNLFGAREIARLSFLTMVEVGAKPLISSPTQSVSQQVQGT
jgi:hypothetical protein